MENASAAPEVHGGARRLQHFTFVKLFSFSGGGGCHENFAQRREQESGGSSASEAAKSTSAILKAVAGVPGTRHTFTRTTAGVLIGNTFVR